MRCAWSASAAVAMMAGVATGDVVKVEMRGVVTLSVDSDINLGDEVIVAFSYDDAWDATSPPANPRPYPVATLLEFQAGAVSWGAAVGGDQLVYQASDRYDARWNSGGSVHLFLAFQGPGGTLGDDSLPTATELLGLTDSVLGAFQPFGDLVLFRFDEEDVSVVAVPLPPAVWAGLAGLGAVGLMGAVRRRLAG